MTRTQKLVIRLFPLALVVTFGGLLLWHGLTHYSVYGILFGCIALIYAVVRVDVVLTQVRRDLR